MSGEENLPPCSRYCIEDKPYIVCKKPIHCKKCLTIFQSSADMSLTKLSLAGNNLIIPNQGEFGYSDIPAGDGNFADNFGQCICHFLN
jgi:hypothetical protein